MDPIAPPTRRFGVKQCSSSGKEKTRCIDDYKESRVNALCRVRGKIRMGRIEDMLETARQLQEMFPDERLVIFKGDYKSAYRCVPIRPKHYPYAKILVSDPRDGSLRQAQQFAMPFGGIAAVYGWDRLAHALNYLIRYVLMLPACRFVDDFFGVCFESEIHFVRDCLLELIEMLGFRLQAEKTPVPGCVQVVLGIRLEVKYVTRREKTTTNIYASIEPAKAKHWVALMESILQEGHITAKAAERLAGRLKFAAYAVAGRVGAARVRYVYYLAATSGGKIIAQAAEELRWWIRYLRMAHKCRFPLRGINLPTTFVYADAEGGGGIGGCLFVEDSARGQKLSFSDRLDKQFTDVLEERKTQISPFEAMALAVAIEVFKMHIAGTSVFF